MLPDITPFIDAVQAERGAFFDLQLPITIARAPVGLDVMGGLATRSGSLVLGMPLADATLVAMQPDPEPIIRVLHQPDVLLDRAASTPLVELPLAALMAGDAPIEYEPAHALLTHNPETAWAAPILACWLTLMREEFVLFDGGMRVFLRSAVPLEGSTSLATLTVATMQALTTLGNVRIDPREIAMMCHRIGVRFGDATTSIIHAVTAMRGDERQILPVACQPCTVLDGIPLPNELAVWGIDTGPTPLTNDYDRRLAHVGALMGYRIIADALGLPVELASTAGASAVRIRDQRWRGYLANISPSEYEQTYRDQLPAQITGSEFLRRFGGVTDPTAQIDEAQPYAVQHATAHALSENFRVLLGMTLLREMNTSEHVAAVAPLLGELLYQSHASYARCVPALDDGNALIDMVRAVGAGQGLYGARVTASGSIALLGRADAGERVQTVVDRYTHTTGRRATMLSGSSPGAQAFGTQPIIVETVLVPEGESETEN